MLWIYDHESKRIAACETEALPYLRWVGLTRAQFVGASRAPVAWTDRRLLEKYDRLCRMWGGPLPVYSAFHALAGRAHKGQSLHYAGLALDVGHSLAPAELEDLRRLALKYGDFTYVEPAHVAPTWVHVELAVAPSASGGFFGYPELSPKDEGVYVFLLQDALRLLGLYHDALTGRFNRSTAQGLKSFYQTAKLPGDGVVSAAAWRALMAALSKAKLKEGAPPLL